MRLCLDAHTCLYAYLTGISLFVFFWVGGSLLLVEGQRLFGSSDSTCMLAHGQSCCSLVWPAQQGSQYVIPQTTSIGSCVLVSCPPLMHASPSQLPTHRPSLPSPCVCVSRVTLLKPSPAWCQRQVLACWSTTTHHFAWAGSGRTRCGGNTTTQHTTGTTSTADMMHSSTCFRPSFYCLQAGNTHQQAFHPCWMC